MDYNENKYRIEVSDALSRLTNRNPLGPSQKEN